MYRHEKKIPTILALFILAIGIGGVVLLNQTTHQLSSQAQATASPLDIHFTNISATSFTVSWFTATNVLGTAVINDNGRSVSFLEDSDSDNIARPRIAHFVTVKNLAENTSYGVKIISGETSCKFSQNCPTFTQKTGNRVGTPLTLPAARGSIATEDGKPAADVLVYITVGKNAPLSGKTDSSGLWVIPFNNLRTEDLLSTPNLKDDDIVQIIAKVAADKQTEAVIDVKSIRQNLTIPTLIIGKSYNLIDLISKKDLLANLNNSNTLGLTTQIGTPNNISAAATSKPIDILFPAADDDTTTDNQPRLRGIGIAGKQLVITVNSLPQTARINVAADGTWSWRPPLPLESGTHYLGVSGYDSNGNLINITRRFIVLKSGERVLGEATASATLTPTTKLSPSPTLVTLPSPTITLIPIASPTGNPTISVGTPSATPIVPPKTGSTNSTLILLGGGASLLLLGLKFLLFP